MTTRKDDYRRSNLSAVVQQVAQWLNSWLSDQNWALRRMTVGAMLSMALIAFELFNFDTTEYALENLLGTVSSAGVRWATILAIAFCSIDFAGLARLLMRDPEPARGTLLGRPSWLILGAWLLGGAMNAIMTWWAVSLALLNHNLGNELMSRTQLLHVVPIFVAILVWMTRILIIGSFLSAADRALAGMPVMRSQGRVSTPRRASVPAGPPKREPAAAKSTTTPQKSAPQATTPAQQTVQPPARPAGRANGRPSNGPVLPRAPRGSRPSTVPLQMRRNPAGRRQDLS